MPRPNHVSIIDEIGMKKTMPATPEQFEWRVNKTLDDAPVVFLGLGPEPDKVPEWFDLPNDEIIFFLESQAFIDQVKDWEPRLPENFQRITPEEFTRDSAANAHVVRYLPVQRAFPTDFGPLTARITLGDKELPRLNKTVWIPTSDTDLLGRELAQAFRDAGYSVTMIDHVQLGKHPGNTLPEILQEGVPDLFLSVNFKGLDHFGLGYTILKEAGAEVAIWLVDNPFNLLTSVKALYWKNARLFVTDHTFIGPLINTGAKWVTHLPLGTSRELFETGGELPQHGHGLEDRLVFVGRSAFPDKDKFFAGLTVPADQMTTIKNHPHEKRYDFHWWTEQLKTLPPWPGNAIRQIGAGAEWAGKHWKKVCLESAGPIVIFGDTGWQALDNDRAEVRGPVDYYDHLPAIYRSASVTLNATGMQLPAGLTQRHFDVWCAGGFLITDANPGLQIFPDELVDPIRYTKPDEIRDLFLQYRQETETKQELRAAWRECILQDHTYANRVETILTALSL
ncbi:glycosyltransferase family protein [Pseudodesulfovibrio sediminis]|uniref:Spore protein YkvP/CgeB glycosyl transferase-like domain-containing protein n=1 Tax=Pseudodesulfovibrio sediminis TaxID=2810563 RepID=A0ABM7P4K0_9BACT|nr:glycosyltransferase [Pseudodesulfovibrio sediminis]BCS87833.1 hypothetical protein PSDVSF_10750 [Pseudodesulfovibrio sediminis]